MWINNVYYTRFVALNCMLKHIIMEISERALIARINRKLAHDGEKLRKSRGMQAYTNLGDYYTVDIKTNTLRRWFIDIEEFGREVGVMHRNETLHN